MDIAIKPLAINDISSWLFFERKNQDDLYCIGSMSNDKFIEVPEKIKDYVLCAIKYFDNTHTINEIQEILREKHNISIDVQNLYNIMEKAGLIKNGDISLIERSEFDKFAFKLAEFNMDGLYNIFSKLTNFITLFLIFSVAIIPMGLIKIIKKFSVLYNPNSYKICDSYILGIVLILVAFGVSITIHELSHAIVASKYKLKPSKLIFSLYLYMSPMIYLRIPGLYTIKPKERIFTWIAGIYSNIFLASLCALSIDYLSGVPLKALYLFIYANLALFIINLSPLLPLDGYFMISTLLKKPNLRKKSFGEFKKFIFRKNNEFNGIFILYFILSSTFMMFFILSQLTVFTKAILESYTIHRSILAVIWDLKVYVIISFSMITIKIKNRMKSINK